MISLETYLEKAWSRYVQITPDAPKVHGLLEGRGEKVLNDHIAFRTFNLPGIGRHEVGAIFERWGYRKSGEVLEFPEKKLKANYWLHERDEFPKVFVSELLLEEVSSGLRAWIEEITKPWKGRKIGADDLLQTNWEPIDYASYEKFYSESEYAAWTAAFGIQLNHFTVSINHLKTFSGIHELNGFLQANGIVLNEAGGLVKGTPSELLEQSSTKARKVDCEFSDGKHEILGCYYEFAKRYPIPGTDRLFEGFIPKSADKIFESTYDQKKS